MRPGHALAAAGRSQLQQPSDATATGSTAVRFRCRPFTVTAQKEVEDIQDAPVSVTAVTADDSEQTGVAKRQRGRRSSRPTLSSHEFTARKLSNPRFRGIGVQPE